MTSVADLMPELVHLQMPEFVDLNDDPKVLEDVLAHPDGQGFDEDNSRKIWEKVRRGYDDADECKDRAYLIDREIGAEMKDVMQRFDCNTPTTVDRVSLDFVCWLE
jgi:hypothetical protein